MPPVTLDWFHIIALLGGVQGLILTGVLAARRENRTANRILAAAVFTFTVYLVSTVYHAAQLERTFPHFFGIGYPVPLLFGPLIYLYAESASDRRRRLERRDALHFVPFVLAVVGGLPIYMLSAAGKLAFHEALLSGERPLLVSVLDPLKLLSGIVYAAATLRLLLRHRDRVKQSYSHVERVNLHWLLWLGVSAAAIWLLAAVFELTGSAGLFRPESGDSVITVAIALLVYGIGYTGLKQPEVFRYEFLDAPAPASPAEAPRYERSGLTPDEASALRDALLATMDKQRPWQDSELTLADLAAMLSTTPHKVSEVLNARVGQTFYDFVNGYRVREVQRRITHDKNAAPTLLALAFDAGFASKSTFNDAFKKHTGQTPSAYRRAAIQ